MKNNLLFGLAGFLLLSSGMTSCKNTEEEQTVRKDDRPNIVMFFTDDNDFSYWGFGGGPDLSPTIDQIVNEGIEATQFYCSAPVCTPSRYSLHTGRFAGRCEDEEFIQSFPEDQPYNIIWNTFLDSEKEYTLGEMLQNAGYTTGFVGKWHLGFDRSEFQLPKDADVFDPKVDSVLKAYQAAIANHIKQAGFDYAASIVPQNNDDNFIDALQYHNLEWYAKGAIDFLEMNKNSEKPLFLIVNITTHHGPCHIESINSDIRITQAGIVEGLDKVMAPRESIQERIMEKGYPFNFKTAGTVWTDDCVEAVVNKLEKNNLENSSAVIFTTDHNRYDGKATCYQGGVHIPFGMKWPGVIKAGTKTNKRMSIQDLMPTFAAMVETSIPDSIKIDGLNRLEYLKKSKNVRNDDETLFFEFGYSRAVLSGKYKYIAFRLPDELVENMKNGIVEESYTLKGMLQDEPSVLRYPYYFDADQLYDLEVDPEEQHNLAYDLEYEGILKQMRERLKNYTESFRNPFPVDNPDPFYRSGEYQKLNEEARDINMEQYYWYRKGCY
ncbi:MAG: sulfatase family protein [Bacteroidales bacterium]